MRKSVLFAALFIPLLIAGVAFAEAPYPGLDDSTRTYLTGLVAPAGEGRVFVAYRSLGFERSGNRLYGYIWAYAQQYGLNGSELQKGEAFSSPLVMIYTYSGGSYRVTMHQQPMGGSFFSASVRNIFPARYCDEILSHRGESSLAASVEAQARTYFNVGY